LGIDSISVEPDAIVTTLRVLDMEKQFAAASSRQVA
jgi:hypothetical protein